MRLTLFQLKRAALNSTLLVISAGTGLVLAEATGRLFLNPADYLSVEMIEDPILGATPSVAAKGHGFDQWGFRNRQVPPSAEIVAIGDSHTYGNTARMDDSWPYVLGRLSHKTVYNMGMGGYGPNQYLHLLKTKAVALAPRIVLCGLYLGDDFENAYTITYGLEHWAYLRHLPEKEMRPDIWGTAPVPIKWNKRIRIWLSRHSVVYQLLFHGPLSGRVQGELQIRNAARLFASAMSLDIPDKGILEAFLPQHILRRIDQESAAVREGMRITFDILKEMDEICRRNHSQFVVVLIPIKELVFADYLEHQAGLSQRTTVGQLIVNARIAKEKTCRFLTYAGISYIDVLPALTKAVAQQLYARTAADMHPSRNGYKVIAEAVADDLTACRINRMTSEGQPQRLGTMK